jgi:phosphopantetheinyl transferase
MTHPDRSTMSLHHRTASAGVLVLMDDRSGWEGSRGPRERAESQALRARMSPVRFESYRLGRSAAHRALAHWLPPSVHLRTEVLRGPLGQPLAAVGDADVAEVSISHCPGLAAAVASERGRPVAVDVEPRSRATARSARRAATSSDWKVAQEAGLPEETAALALWTVREAVGKTLRTGLVVASHVLDVASIEATGPDTYEVRFRNLPSMKGVTKVLDDAVVSLATPCARETPLRLAAREQPARPPGASRCDVFDVQQGADRVLHATC